jgi:hypothetical protein
VLFPRFRQVDSCLVEEAFNSRGPRSIGQLSGPEGMRAEMARRTLAREIESIALDNRERKDKPIERN